MPFVGARRRAISAIRRHNHRWSFLPPSFHPPTSSGYYPPTSNPRSTPNSTKLPPNCQGGEVANNNVKGDAVILAHGHHVVKSGQDATSILRAQKRSIGVSIHKQASKFSQDLARILHFFGVSDKHCEPFERIPVNRQMPGPTKIHHDGMFSRC